MLDCYNMLLSFKNRIVLVTFFAYTTLCAIAGPLENREKLNDNFPGTYDQEIDLAAAVCAELGVVHSSICQKKFLYDRGNFGELPPELEIKCQSEETVTFATSPTKHWQLVILVNEENHGEIINYRIIEGAASVRISTMTRGKFNKTYTFWTTFLDMAGNHATWRRGPDVQPWDNMYQQIEHKTYNISVDFLYNRYVNESFIDATISWNTNDGPCFYVYNICNRKTLGNVFHKDIEPDQDQWVIVDVPLDDNCTFTVKGSRGHGQLVYTTPACHLLNGCHAQPVKVDNLDISAMEDEDGRWVVEVTWNEPKYPQDLFNVTLLTDRMCSVIILKNSTGAKFENVTGEGWYDVIVTSRIENRTAVESRSAIFPPRAQAAWRLLVGAAWVTLLLALFVIAILFWCKKRRQDKRRGHYYASIQDKAMKFSEAESTQELITEDRWEVQPELVQLYEVLGEGAFGVVRRGTLEPGSREVAVKMLKEFPSAEEVRSFRSEMELMKSVGAHPHVVSLVACCSGRRPLLVVEYCSRGDLLSYLRCAWDMMVTKRNARYYNNNKEKLDYRNDFFKSKELSEQPQLVVNRLYDLQGVCDTELTIPDLLSFCRQIAKGMEFLSSNRVVHRDLAARNILVTADRTLKIADFGLSRDVYQENQYKQQGNGKMPLKWMALESLTHRVYTTQSDVWSFGVVMWEVMTLGGAPYEALDCARLPRLLRAGYRMPRPQNCDPQLYELMLSCWHERARSRPTFAELLERLDALLAAAAHPYLPLDLHVPDRPDSLPPAYHLPAPYRYVRMLFRSERIWGRGRSYEWPTCAVKHNYYTPRPATLTTQPDNHITRPDCSKSVKLFQT